MLKRTGLFVIALTAAAAMAAIGAPDALNLPPPTTPARLLKPTPPPTEARQELDAFKQLLPKAFYDEDFPERYRPLIELMARDEYERERGYQFDKIIRGNPKKKLLALTFDDGPHAVFTLELLNLLAKLNVKATFFLVGKQVEKFPTLVQLEVIAGDEIGNHTYDHVNLTQIPPELIPYELEQSDKEIRDATGSSVRFFRPPGGDYDADVLREAAKLNYVTTLWTDDPGDYASPGAAVILKRTLDHLEPGAILLLHDGIPETMQVLPQIVAEAHKRGYEFVTLSQLADSR